MADLILGHVCLSIPGDFLAVIESQTEILIKFTR